MVWVVGVAAAASAAFAATAVAHSAKNAHFNSYFIHSQSLTQRTSRVNLRPIFPDLKETNIIESLYRLHLVAIKQRLSFSASISIAVG